MPLTDLYSVLGGGGVMVGSKSKSPSLDINVQVASRLLVLRPAYTVVPFVCLLELCQTARGQPRAQKAIYLEQSK